MTLPLIIAPNDPGHIDDHQEIHTLLGRLDGQSTFLAAGSTTGALGSRPAASASNLGSFYYAASVPSLAFSDGALWREQVMAAASNTFTGINNFNEDVFFGSGRPWADPMNATYGAVGDGVADDTGAVKAAADAMIALGGGDVFISQDHGVSGASGVVVTNAARVGFVGGGGLIKRIGTPTTSRLFTFTSCTDLRIANIDFDVNGTTGGGGLAINSCTRVWVHHCRAWDSNLNGNWTSVDHYWLVPQGCTDVSICFNHATDVELVEANNNTRVRIKFNTSVGAAGTTAIGWFAVADGTYAYDYEIDHNLIIDPRKVAISVTYETGGRDNNVLSQVFIRCNTIRYQNVDPAANRSIQVGWFGGAAVLTGNSSEAIRIEGNDIWVNSAYTPTVQRIAMVMPASGNDFSRSSVTHNRVTGAGTDFHIDVRWLSDCVVAWNESYGGSLGIVVDNAQRTFYFGNYVNASSTTYRHTTSRGNNVIAWNRSISGTWGTLSLTSTDKLYPSNNGLLTGSNTNAPGTIATHASASMTVTCTGARVGDVPHVAWESTAASTGIVMGRAYVSATHTVTVVFTNATGGGIDPGTITAYADVVPV